MTTPTDPRGNPEVSGGEPDTTQPGPPGSTGPGYRAPGGPVNEPTTGEADTTYPGAGTQAPEYSTGTGGTTATPPSGYTAGQQDTSTMGGGSIGAGVGGGALPAAPAKPTAVAAPRGATVTFAPVAAPSGSHIQGYLVRANPANAADSVQEMSVPATATTATFGNLTPTHNYTFVVAATSNRGTGPFSPASDPVTAGAAGGTPNPAYA